MERAAAWDEHLDQRVRERKLDDVEKMSRQHAQQAQAACAIAAFAAQEALLVARMPASPARDAKLKEAEKILGLLQMAGDANKSLHRWQDSERSARGVSITVVDKDGLAQGANIQWELRIDGPPPGHERIDPEQYFGERSSRLEALVDPAEPEEEDDPNVDRADPIPRFK